MSISEKLTVAIALRGAIEEYEQASAVLSQEWGRITSVIPETATIGSRLYPYVESFDEVHGNVIPWARAFVEEVNRIIQQIEKEETPPEGIPDKVKKYVDSNTLICPHCGADDISGGEITIEGMSAVQEVDCSACGGSWRDCYLMDAVVVDDKEYDIRPLLEPKQEG